MKKIWYILIFALFSLGAAYVIQNYEGLQTFRVIDVPDDETRRRLNHNFSYLDDRGDSITNIIDPSDSTAILNYLMVNDSLIVNDSTLYVNGVTHRVGINNAHPATTLDVQVDTNTYAGLRVRNLNDGSNAYSGISLRNDVNRLTGIGITGSNNAFFGAHVPIWIGDGRNNMKLINDGNYGFEFWTDESDTHFFVYTLKGKLDSLGNFWNKGDMTVGGDFSMEDYQWKDLRFPLNRDRQGVAQKPDYDYTDLGLLFPQNDETEEAYIIAQFNHDYVLGDSISPHIHYFQDEVAIPVYEMTYRWEDNGEAVGGWTTIETKPTPEFTYISGTIRQILEFPMIDGSGISGVSSMMDIIIRRQTGDGVTGDVLTKEFDIHYPVDKLGSDTEYVK